MAGLCAGIALILGDYGKRLDLNAGVAVTTGQLEVLRCAAVLIGEQALRRYFLQVLRVCREGVRRYDGAGADGGVLSVTHPGAREQRVSGLVPACSGAGSAG